MNNKACFRIAKYKKLQTVTLKLTASEVQVIQDILYKEGHFNITDRILDQMCGKHSVEWIVI